MEGQGKTHTGALNELFDSTRPSYTLRYKLAWRLRMAKCWTQYALVGGRLGVPELAEFVCGNHFFFAMQVRSELTALGEILAEQQPTRALEIGTAHGGTLLFLTRLANPEATIASLDLPEGTLEGAWLRLQHD